MLTGPNLGKALREAMALKRVTQQRVADEFGIQQPSVATWLRFGRIGKQHIGKLVEFFADEVGPEHWGLPPNWTAPGHDGEPPLDGEVYTVLRVAKPENRPPLAPHELAQLVDSVLSLPGTRARDLLERVTREAAEFREYLASARAVEEPRRPDVATRAERGPAYKLAAPPKRASGAEAGGSVPQAARSGLMVGGFNKKQPDGNKK